jgi:hypothetical protein
MKRGLRFLVIAVVILIIGSIAGRKYLTSRGMAARVASRLEALYGGSVRLEQVDIGLGSSSLTSIQLFEKEDAAARKPWATIDALEADISFLSLLRGATPESVKLTGVAVTLRFDEDGHLLTQFPDRPASETGKEVALPKLHIDRGRVILQREGGVSVVMSGIDAMLESKGDQVILSGAAENADKSAWGTWTMEGVLDRQTKQSSITLKSDQIIHVTQAMLNQLPFLPTSLWQALQVEGETAVAVTIRYDLADSALHYRVELQPRETAVHVPAIELVARAGEGRIIINDGLVELRDVQGQAFEGTIRADADLDFRKAMTRLDVSKVEVQGLNMRRLPESWGLPRQIEGHLSGSAWMEVVLGPGKPQTRGEGHGEIVAARVAGQQTSGPIRLELHAKEGGFSFRERPPKIEQPPGSNEEKVLPDVLPAQHGPSEKVPLVAQLVDDLYAGLAHVARGIAGAGTRLVGSLPDKITFARPKPPEQGRYVQVNLQMDRVDLALFVKGLGLELPFAVGGWLSFQVQASIPLDSPGDLKTYRVQGSAHVVQLQLADLELDDIRTKLTYANGVLSLHEIKGCLADLPGADVEETAGTFQGSARLELVPLGGLKADMKLDRIPLRRVAVLTGAAESVRGTLSGTIVARAPAAQLQAVNGWEATATITTSKAQAFGWAIQDSAAQVRMNQGTLTLADLRVQVEGTPITGSAEMRLAAPYPYHGQFALRDGDSSALQRLAPKAWLPIPIAGHFDAKVALRGTLQPLTDVAMDLELRAPRIELEGIPTRHLQGTLAYRQGTVAYHFQGSTLGGRFDLNGQLSTIPNAQEPTEGYLHVEGALLSRVKQIFHMDPDALPLRGRVDLEIRFRHEGADHIPVGHGRVIVTRPRWGEIELAETVQGEVLLTRQALQLREITATVGGGLLRSQLSLNLHRLERSWFTASLEGIDAAWVLRLWPSLAGKVDGLLEAHLRGRLGREWSGSGDLFLGRGKVWGVEVADWRVPLTWSFSPSDGRGEITFPESSAHLAAGRATGQGSLRWNSGLNIEGHVHFFGLELRTLLRQATDSNHFGNGRLTGRLDFVGNDVHSADDLTGTLEAELAQTQAFQFPVLRQVAPFLGMQTSSTFDRGQLRARLARGVIGVQSLSLQGAIVQMSVEGNAALSGRLDLTVTAGPGANNRESARPPLLSLPNGLLRLRVTGTVNAPTIRVEPMSLLAR